MRTDWDKIISGIQIGMVWFIIGLVSLCTLVLVFADTFIGAGTMYFFTAGKTGLSFLISMATTGLLMAIAFMGYTIIEKTEYSIFGWALLILSIGFYLLDTYFDSLAADVLRFGEIATVANLPDKTNHILFRILIGGISTLGEPLAVGILIGLPVMKKMIESIIPRHGMTFQTINNKNNKHLKFNHRQVDDFGIPDRNKRHEQFRTITKPEDFYKNRSSHENQLPRFDKNFNQDGNRRNRDFGDQ